MNESINIWEEKNLTDHNLNLTQNVENAKCNTTGVMQMNCEKKILKDTTKSGIYKIINKVNGKYYVGSSVNIQRRWYNHKRHLKINIHNNPLLQNAWNKYNEKSFEFIIVENINIDKTSPKNLLLDIEQKYLDIAKNEKDKCYNVSFNATAPFLGRKTSDETKLKLSKAGKGKRRSEEFKSKLSESRKGINNPMYGRKLTDKQLLNYSIASKEKWNNEEYRKKHCGENHSFFGKNLSESHRFKISESNKGKKLSDKTKFKISKANSGEKHRDYDHNIYKWYNQKTNIYEECTQYDLRIKYNLVSSCLSRVINKERKHHKDWIVVEI